MCNNKCWQSLRKVLSLVEKEPRIFHCLGNASAQPILFTALDIFYQDPKHLALLGEIIKSLSF